MGPITITRPVLVKVKVTDTFKKLVAAEAHATLAKMDAQLDQLETQSRKILDLGKKSPGIASSLQQIEEERQKTIEARRQLNERLREVGRMAEGQEIVQGRLESLVEIKEGDNWEEIMNVEIVVLDGKVLEIRQGA